jgi:D-alanyl-D-alanine carboxypeptidase (penicillin-binding protein 5/6)
VKRLAGVLAGACAALALLGGASARAAAPALSVRAAALIDAATGQRLYGRNADAQVPIASTTKLMTALLTLEQTKPAQVFAEPDFSLPDTASQIGLSPGERMTVRDLLIALLLPSADDAAQDLAYNIGRGSVDRFISMMNSRAVTLGLAHTHYTTPIGLDTPGNYSSAWDLVSLARYLLHHHPFFRHVVGLSSAVLHSGATDRQVINRNDLVGRIPWVNGVKTGHTLDAGYVLVGSGTRNGLTLISVVLGTSSESSRDANTLALLDYGLRNFHVLTPVSAGQPLAVVAVRGRPKLQTQLVAVGSFRHVFARSEHIRTVVQAPRLVVGPRASREVVGSVVVLADGRPVARVPLALAAAVPAPPPPTDWRTFTLIGIALLLAVLTVVIVWQLQRSRAGRATEKRTAA